VIWVAKAFGSQLVSWAAGKVIDEVVERSGLARLGRAAAHNLMSVSRQQGVSPADRQELRDIAQRFSTISELLSRNDLNDRQVRAALQRLSTRFDVEMQAVQRRLASLDQRISALEVEQRRQMKMLIDHQGRIGMLEGQIVDHEGRLRRIETTQREHGDRILTLEETVFPDRNRFLRHEAYLSGGLLYANAVELGSDAAVGGQLEGQYNFNQHFGIFVGLQLAPLRASDAAGMPSGSAVTWENANAHIGAVAHLLPPGQPISMQIGAGGGIAQTDLVYFAPGADRSNSDAGTSLGQSSNVYMVVRADVGVAPPAFDFEPMLSVGYMTFFEDIAYADDAISSNAGQAIWYASVGLRWRVCLRCESRKK
jgi:hypothetical protein